MKVMSDERAYFYLVVCGVAASILVDSINVLRSEIPFFLGFQFKKCKLPLQSRGDRVISA